MMKSKFILLIISIFVTSSFKSKYHRISDQNRFKLFDKQLNILFMKNKIVKNNAIHDRDHLISKNVSQLSHFTTYNDLYVEINYFEIRVN